ncbi:RhuM family protein [Rhodonellum sp.]|uniref:RhuM family protein n=1 Tax=Rhodonellum sp. TaxID=2231180 RepID=UPI00351EDFB3
MNDVREWATQTLNEFIIKGFVLVDERFQQGINFRQDFFEELQERIREIRDCQPKFYQKITDLYAWSSDHVKESRQTKDFPASDQNKLQFHCKLTEM